MPRWCLQHHSTNTVMIFAPVSPRKTIYGISAEKRITARYPCLDSLMAPCWTRATTQSSFWWLVMPQAWEVPDGLLCCWSHESRSTFHLSEGMAAFPAIEKGYHVPPRPVTSTSWGRPSILDRCDHTHTHNTIVPISLHQVNCRHVLLVAPSSQQYGCSRLQKLRRRDYSRP